MTGASPAGPPDSALDAELDAELEAVVAQLPPFLRYPIFLPTDRVPVREAIEGLWRVSDLYAEGLDQTYRPRLRALKAARRGRRCFVIGNGPSLARTDLAKLTGETTFATNGFFLKMPELDWRPTYYVVEDHLVGEDRADELNALRGTTKLFPASLAYAIRPDDETIYFDHRPRKSYPHGFDFSFDADVHTFTGGTVTFTCLQLAAYLGFQEIYLIGVDADYAIPADAALSGNGRVKEIDMASDDPNHFHPDYFGKGKRWHEPNVEVMLGAYAEARRATEARGVSIANATIGGKLEVFPRVDYELLFRPAPEERLLVIDHTRIGDATATGAVKAAVLGGWPPDDVLQLWDRSRGELRLTGGAAATAGAAATGGAGEPTGDFGPDDRGSLEPGVIAERVAVFEPDLILYRPVPLKDALHDVAMDLIARSNLPLALWIVDDWPSDYARQDPINAARLEADFRRLVARADACFSISPAMSAAFHARYGRLFVPVANGVDPADWEPARLRPAGPVVVRYAGSLAENMTLASVQLVAQAVEQLAAEGIQVSLEIRTHPHWRNTATGWLDELAHTTVTTSDLSADAYRGWLAEADVLLIAYNFDDRSRDYIRYSLANKLPECLASGAAVLAVGPEDVGTIAAMAGIEAGERITTPDATAVLATLRRLASSPEARLELGRRGQELAFAHFGLRQTRQAFDATVGRVAAAHRSGDYPRDLHAHVDETEVVAGLLEDRTGAEHVLLDVGAHGGSSAIHFARLGWTVRCFEPDPEHREALAARFATNPNVAVDPRAVSDQAGARVPLYASPESSGITALHPFHESHRPVAMADVTTIAQVVDEVGIQQVDFLKVDVEGLDLAVLRGVPWDRLAPEVVECEFEDAKTLALGHSWRDIAAFLQARGYAVYVSEWHPIVRYGARHDWRRVAPFTPDLAVDAAAWGNLLAFREDPGWALVRRAFDRKIERGSVTQLQPPERASTASTTAPGEATGSPPAAAIASASAERAAWAARRRRRRSPLGRLGVVLRRRAPTTYRMLRLGRRALRGLWKRRRWTVPLATLLLLWTLAGFLPALAPVDWLIWGIAAIGTVGLFSLYAMYRVAALTSASSRHIARQRRAQRQLQKRLAEANARVARLERARNDTANVDADLLRRIRELEAALAERHEDRQP